jgi:hypothetical protein
MGSCPGRLRYLPVGFGDHHWELTDAAGGHWFVTVAELAGGWRGTGPADGYADLQAAMETVIALSQAGMEFAVAPVRTTGGQALAPLGQRNAVTVFPYVDVMAGTSVMRCPSPTGLPSSTSWRGFTTPPRWPGGRRRPAAPSRPAAQHGLRA